MLSLPVPAACVCLSVQAKVVVCRTSSRASVESAFHSPCTVMVQSTAVMAPMKLTAEVSVCRRSPECASTIHTITLLQVTLLHWVYWVLVVCLQYTVYSIYCPPSQNNKPMPVLGIQCTNQPDGHSDTILWNLALFQVPVSHYNHTKTLLLQCVYSRLCCPCCS